MAADLSPLPPTLLLVVDLIDTDSGLAEVEDDQGRTYAFPANWLPQAADGQAYQVSVRDQGVQFVVEPDGAARLREKSKQTLLEFSDDFTAEQAVQDEQP